MPLPCPATASGVMSRLLLASCYTQLFFALQATKAGAEAWERGYNPRVSYNYFFAGDRWLHFECTTLRTQGLHVHRDRGWLEILLDFKRL